MGVFELVVGLLLVGALLSILGERLAVPTPALLALTGAAVALLPGVPAVELDPGLALALFVAPILVRSGHDMSLRDLREHWVPVLGLVVNLVALTTAAVAVVAHWLLPELPWAAAVALGAVVAPSDASAAAPVLRRLSPPHRAQVILEGESLLNDATALLLFRLAVVATAGQMTAAWAVPFYLFTTLAGLALGAGLGWLFTRLRVRARDTGTVVMCQFLATFGLWLLAERLQVSAILTMVAFAVVLGRYGPRHITPRQRIASTEIWNVAVHVLTVLAFILTGLQLKTVLSRLDGNWGLYLGFAVAVCVVVILVRIVWVLGWTGTIILKNRIFGVARRREGLTSPTLKLATFVGWSGMRGVVTLATAIALPDDFPQRDLLVFTAFSVVLVTLVLQGFTVAPLLRWLRIEDDHAVARETALARAVVVRAALACLQNGTADAPETSAGAALRRDYEERLRRAERPAGAAAVAPELAGLRRDLLQAERSALHMLRTTDRIGTAAYRTVAAELDWTEVLVSSLLEPD